MSLETRIEKRRQPRNYKPHGLAEIMRNMPPVVVPPPAVNVAAPNVNVEAPVVNVPAIPFGEIMEDFAKRITEEIRKPRKVVCDKDGEPIGTVQVESL